MPLGNIPYTHFIFMKFVSFLSDRWRRSEPSDYTPLSPRSMSSAPKKRLHSLRLEAVSSPSKKARTSGTIGAGESQPHPFVWKKKLEQQRKSGFTPTPETEAARIKALHEELAEAQHQRAQRDAERAERQAEAARQARLSEQQLHSSQHQQDATFEGTQHFARQAIRLRQQRPTRADFLARIVRLDLLDLPNPTPHLVQDTPLHSRVVVPGSDVIHIINSIPKDIIQSVLDAVEEELEYVPDFTTEHDNSTFNVDIRFDFWESAHVVVKDRLQRAGSEGKSLQGVHVSVSSDVNEFLAGKSTEKLREIKEEIETRLNQGSNSGEPGMFGEADFWTSALHRISVLLAEEKLSTLTDILHKERVRRTEMLSLSTQRKSPAAEDLRAKTSEEEMVRIEAAKGMEQNEEAFADEVDLKTRNAHTSDISDGGQGASRNSHNGQARLRKPLYFNRVHTGYNWSKYNRTHYDHDNPPPKTVQGYKFNIFYPDLMQVAKTPTYKITRTENPEVSIITFKAGPPYQDIAFKIVNRPWERSHKRGFRCSFERGVLQLWFHFQRYRYRR